MTILDFITITTIPAAFGFLGGMVYRDYSSKKKNDEDSKLLESEEELPAQPQPQIITETIIDSVVIENNKTGKFFTFNSINNFGIGWDWFGDAKGFDQQLLIMKQYTAYKGFQPNTERPYGKTAMFIDHSIGSIVYKSVSKPNPLYVEPDTNDNEGANNKQE